MPWVLYLIAGVLVEAYVIMGYIEDGVPFSNSEIFLGAIIDILIWPIMLLNELINGLFE